MFTNQIQQKKNEKNIDFFENIARQLLYIIFIIYVTTLVIFFRPENVILSNLANVALVGFFLFYQVIFTSKTFYFNSFLLGYFIFFLYSAISLAWSVDVVQSTYTVTRMIQIFINLVFIYNIVKIFKFHKAIFIGFMLGTFYNVLLAVGIVEVNYLLYFDGTTRYMGTTINPNIIGGMMLLSLTGSILFIQLTKSKFWLMANVVNLLMSMYIILLTVSRTNLIIGLGILFVFMAQMVTNRHTRGYFFLTIIVIVGAVVMFTDLDDLMEKMSFAVERIGFIIDALNGKGTEKSAGDRLKLIGVAMSIFYNNPFFGTGIDTMKSFLSGLYAHNNYAELLGDVGLVGTLIYYSIYINLIKKVLYFNDRWMRIYLLVFIFAFLLYDLGGVTYYAKLQLMTLLLYSYIVEEDMKTYIQN